MEFFQLFPQHPEIKQLRATLHTAEHMTEIPALIIRDKPPLQPRKMEVAGPLVRHFAEQLFAELPAGQRAYEIARLGDEERPFDVSLLSALGS